MKKLLMMIGAAAVATSATLPARADAVRTYDVDDYVQEGLVAHFDAIRNAGATVAHDNSAATWANLVDAANYADFTLKPGSASAGWTDIAYQFTNNCMASTISAIDLGTNFTVQIAVTADPSAQTSGRIYHVWFNDNPKNDYGFWTYSNGTEITGNFKKLDSSGSARQTISSWGGEYVTWMLDGANSRCYTFETDTIPEGKSLTVVSACPAARKYCWGAELKSGTTLQSFLTADYHNVRMYNRPLSEDEIKQNRKIDEARFRGNCDVTIVNGAIGETGTNGESSFPDGCYNLGDGESWTLTAESIVVDGRRYQPRLMVEEKVDGEWTQVAHIWAESYTLNKASLTNPVRLTWTWEKPNGLIIMFR